MPAWQRKWKNYKYTHTHILKKKPKRHLVLIPVYGTDASTEKRVLVSSPGTSRLKREIIEEI